MVKKNLFEKRTKCVIYIRVSSERQVEGFSLDGQKRELVEYANCLCGGRKIWKEYRG